MEARQKHETVGYQQHTLYSIQETGNSTWYTGQKYRSKRETGRARSGEGVEVELR
jgi:hypothetical protein